MADYTAYYFQTAAGRSPVAEFIDGLDQAAQRKFFAKRLEENLYELRLETHAGAVRVFYCFDDKRIIFVHAMKKKTQKLPAQELAVALQRKQAYLGKTH